MVLGRKRSTKESGTQLSCFLLEYQFFVAYSTVELNGVWKEKV